MVLHCLRQQTKKAADRHNFCLSDFVAPKASGVHDYLGAFAVTAGIGCDERAREFERELEVSVEVVARMRKRGIRVLPGGDYGFLATPHGTYARDLWLFVKILGFSAMEALVAATRLGGELMGRPGELGVVKAGALADLLLVEGDPLADIEVAIQRVRWVMKGGAVVVDRTK